MSTEIYEDALCGLLALELLNGLSNKSFVEYEQLYQEKELKQAA